MCSFPSLINSRQGVVLTFSQFLIVNKTSLSLSLSLSQDRLGRKSRRTLRLDREEASRTIPTCAGQQVPSRRHPHRRIWGVPGKGGALCNRRSTAIPVGPPRPSRIMMMMPFIVLSETNLTLTRRCSGDCDLQLHC
jgi:hypothetical protein